MEGHTVSLMKSADEEANLGPHYAFERLAIWRYYVDEKSAGAQRCGNFQADKAGTNDRYTFC